MNATAQFVIHILDLAMQILNLKLSMDVMVVHIVLLFVQIVSQKLKKTNGYILDLEIVNSRKK